MNNLACALTGIENEQVALCGVSVSAVLHDQLSEVTVSQTYRNDERVNIEAIYTFPIPQDAVLLDLKVEIGGRVLKGVVVEKKAAEDQYEDAVAAGDAAVMLEVIEPGLYTMNVGNLLPRERVTITFCYANMYRWAGDRLRIYLPTTIAPRFGDSPHLPHRVPESSLTVENQFSLQVEIYGSLRDAQFICPSHDVDLIKSAEKVTIALRQVKVAMDRDFILNVKTTQTERSFALCGPDGDGLAAVASFQPFFPGLQRPRPLNIAIVIDCSGSMQGDSMHQAKQALNGILGALQAHDRVTLIAFGNSTRVLSKRLLTCNKTNIAKAKRFAKELDADMGGTAIRVALHDAYSVLCNSDSADIFLVTDGEVSSWEPVVTDAEHSGHRIFTVGVGSTVSEAFVRELATATGGECELVSPREGMAERVIRHFERMRAPRAKRVTVHWPSHACDITPSRLGSVFEGDTVIVSARFDQSSISDHVVLEVETEDGGVFNQKLQIEMAPKLESAGCLSTIARLAASTRLTELDDGPGLKTALRYHLVSPWTNWLVMASRPEGEQAQGIPMLRKVPQTLGAGWGGVGTVHACLSISESAVHEVSSLYLCRKLKLSMASKKMAKFKFKVVGCKKKFKPRTGKKNGFRYIAFLPYYPVRFEVSHKYELVRKAVWNFKDGYKSAIVARDVGNAMLDMNFVKNKEKWWLCVIPASSKKKTKKRFKKFNKIFCKLTGVNNGYHLIVNNGRKRKPKHTMLDRNKIKIKKYVNINDVNGKNILLFDDVYTTGKSFDDITKLLKKHGASKVRGIFLAKTM